MEDLNLSIIGLLSDTLTEGCGDFKATGRREIVKRMYSAAFKLKRLLNCQADWIIKKV